MIKHFFVEELAQGDKIKVAKKDNDYMFLATSRFKFLDIKNFLAPGLSYGGWCKSLECKLQKLVFLYEWLTSHDKLNHVGPVAHENFHTRLSGRNTLSDEEYETFRAAFYRRSCVTMMDWLRKYNLADVEPFIKAVNKTRLQYYEDEIDILKDAVSIPAVLMRYVLNKSLRLNPKLELYVLRDPCRHRCKDSCYSKTRKSCKQVQKTCEKCTRNEAYQLLRTGMVGGPTIVFCRYHEQDVTGIRSHVYGEPHKCRTILGYDANMLYPSALMQDFSCVKKHLIKVAKPTSEHNLGLLTRGVVDGSLFAFAQVDIKVPENLREKFSEMAPLFVVKEIPDDQIPEHMHEYLQNTGRKRVPGTRKLLGLLNAEKVLLYTTVLKWYLEHELKVTAFHQFLKYARGRPFEWFPEDIADARRQADKDPDKRIAGDTAKLKGNSFYGKMIEDLERHANITFTRDEKEVHAALRSPYLEDLEEIGDAYELRRGKHKCTIDRAYQCGIAVYQLAKLRMLEFYYDFLDKYVDRQDFEYTYVDTDSAYFAISGKDFRDVVRPELLDEYDEDVKN
ncbi:uncharacterized protein LOC130660625 [Hydractinia symbiolongicarpus]|uniref:uncharacterized protein LOC130660625 n=1 Tax=Hydractinia symbiolongicarpus TaxID=13093 RepID=UPI00254E5AE8|nr:uncharacterized protein LOC130660625 [Hydractinia symbiolongicarpus]